MATGSPRAPDRIAVDLIQKSGSGKSGFSGNFFSLFFASTDPLGPQGRPRMDRNHLIRTRIREIRFFENPDFSFFRLFELKDPTIWVSMDSPGPPGRAGPTAVLFRYFFGTFRYFFRYLTVLDAFLSLNPLQYGCLWTRLDSIRSLVPVPRYCGTFSVLFLVLISGCFACTCCKLFPL